MNHHFNTRLITKYVMKTSLTNYLNKLVTKQNGFSNLALISFRLKLNVEFIVSKAFNRWKFNNLFIKHDYLSKIAVKESK